MCDVSTKLRDLIRFLGYNDILTYMNKYII